MKPKILNAPPNFANRMIQAVSAVATRARKDGWENILTGLGIAGRDKRLGMEAKWLLLSEMETENIYAGDDIAKKVVDKLPEEGTRKWIGFKMDSEDSSDDLANKVEAEFDRLQVRKAFRKAARWARLKGGALVFVAVDDGRTLEKPLEPKSVREIKALHVLDRYEVSIYKWDEDMNSPNFGMPELYQLSGANVLTNQQQGNLLVHYSRFIRFDGPELPRNLSEVNEGWGDSVLGVLLNVLRNYNLASDSMASAIQDFRIGILKLKHLADMVAQDSADALRERISLMNLSKSVMSAIALDADSESYETNETSFTNVDKVFDKVAMRLVAATGMPHTVILGEGSTGTLGGGGQTEDRMMAHLTAAWQAENLTDPIDRMLEIVCGARKGPVRGDVPEDLDWEFHPLWEMSEKESAEIHKTQAEADQIYLTNQVLDPEEVAKSRFGRTKYSIETTIDLDARERQQAAREQDPNPPTPAPAKVQQSQPGSQEPGEEVQDVADPDHSHWDTMTGGYMSGEQNPGPNHYHIRPNGENSGPAIQLMDGTHVHRIGSRELSGPGVGMRQVQELMSIRASYSEPLEPQAAPIQVQLNTKTQRFDLVGLEEGEKLHGALIDAKDLGAASNIAKLFFELDLLRFEQKDEHFQIGSIPDGSRAVKPPMKGVVLYVGR